MSSITSPRSVRLTSSLTSPRHYHISNQDKRVRYSPYRSSGLSRSDSPSSGSEAEVDERISRTSASPTLSERSNSVIESDSSTESESVYGSFGMRGLNLGGGAKNSLKITSRRSRPPPPLTNTAVRGHHRRTQSLSNPASYGYMLSPLPGSARSIHRDVKVKTEKDTETETKSRTESPSTTPKASYSPTCLYPIRHGRPIVRTPPRRHSEGDEQTTPTQASTDLLQTGLNINIGTGGVIGGEKRGASERMMLVNPAIAEHLRRGGAVSVRSVDGTKRWKIRIPTPQLSVKVEPEDAH